MYKFGVLGVGNMGGSILAGIINSSLYNKEEILLYDIRNEVQENYEKSGFNIAKDEEDLINNVEVLLLSIKPQSLNNLLKYNIHNEKLVIISIVAGKTNEDLKKIFGEKTIIRAMPNTPSLINFGATAISKDDQIDNNTFDIAIKIFESIGSVEVIPDNLLNEIIPLNGSMPAFLYYFANAFIKKAVEDGVEFEVAKRLVCNGIIGSAQMILKENKPIEELIKNVCSPKGATLEGMKVLEEHNVEQTLKKVSKATIKRAYELSNIK